MERPEGFQEIKFTGDFRATQREAALANMRAACQRNLPAIKDMKRPHGRTMVLCGSGPSLKTQLNNLREYVSRSDCDIWTVNEGHDWLINEGITPGVVVYIEVAPWGDDPLFQKESPHTVYCISSAADPSVFDHLSGRNVVLWHAWHGIGEDKLLDELGKPYALVYGGCTPALRAIHLGVVVGYRNFSLFGMESSYETNSHVMRDDERQSWAESQIMEVWCGGRMFKTKPYLAKQAHDFNLFLNRYGHLFSFTVHGDGLLPHMYRSTRNPGN